jgi:hypothetical protein
MGTFFERCWRERNGSIAWKISRCQTEGFPPCGNPVKRLEAVVAIKELRIRNSAFNLRVLRDSHYHAAEGSTN